MSGISFYNPPQNKESKLRELMKALFSYLYQQFSNCDAIFDDLKTLVKTGDFTLGKAVEEFESQFAKAVGSQYVIM